MRESFNFLLFTFTLIFGVVLYDYVSQSFGFTFIDEIICAVLVLNWLLFGRSASGEYLVFGGVFLFYLAWSLMFPNNVEPAIWTDFLIEAKPFLAFYSVSLTSYQFSAEHKKRIRQLCIALAMLLLPVGIMGFGGTGVMVDIGGHARFATINIVLGTAYLYFSERKKGDLLMALLIFSIGLMSTRSKMFGFYVVYIGVMFVWKNQWAKRFFTSRNVIMLLSVFSVMLYVAWGKISFYFIEGDEAFFARPMLYRGMVRILEDYPLFGSGFGSYASYATSIWYSPLYFRYVPESGELMQGLFLCDTFYPCLAQFGLVGIGFFVVFWLRRLRRALSIREYDMVSYKIILVIVLFFLIESLADSTFTHNRGMVMMILLALFAKPRNVVLRKLNK